MNMNRRARQDPYELIAALGPAWEWARAGVEAPIYSRKPAITQGRGSARKAAPEKAGWSMPRTERRISASIATDGSRVPVDQHQAHGVTPSQKSCAMTAMATGSDGRRT